MKVKEGLRDHPRLPLIPPMGQPQEGTKEDLLWVSDVHKEGELRLLPDIMIEPPMEAKRQQKPNKSKVLGQIMLPPPALRERSPRVVRGVIHEWTARHRDAPKKLSPGPRRLNQQSKNQKDKNPCTPQNHRTIPAEI